MTSVPLLYVGVAEPLVQAYCQWRVEVPQAGGPEERQAKLREFPKHQVGAYEIALTEDHSKLEFQTAWHVNPKRVKHEIEKWSKGSPALIDKRLDPVAGLDHEKLRTELKIALKGRPIRIEERIGLTLQQLQRDLSDQTPNLFLLICHGTREGCVLLEDGRGGSDVISGDRLFDVLRSSLPSLVFLSACFSGAILKRAHWNDQGEQCAIVYIDAEHPVEVTAIARFGAEFIAGLLRGGSADVAFEAARRFLMNDTTVGDLSTSPGKTPPSQKFCLHTGGHAVKLSVAGQTSRVSSKPAQVESSAANSAAWPDDPLLLSRRAAQFIGRQRELWQIISALLPKPAGIRESSGATDKRLVTLTKEGGIGKTALALRAVDWIKAREFFSSAVFELSCEDLSSSTAFLAKLLDRFGVPKEQQQGDLLMLLAKQVSQLLGSGTALLVLDNLDDLIGKHAATQSSHPATAVRIIEILLGAAPDLHILTTCRWPLGLAAETPLDIPPLDEDEACNLFVVYLEHPRHQVEVQATWKQVDSAARQLIRLSGYHPQSLCLLAKQMSRSGVTLAKLRDEAKKDLLKVLTDPLAADSDADRLKKVENSYELSYRHLSDPAKHLFQHLAFLPGGVWCGTFPENNLNWGKLLGDNWRNLLESELKYFALMDFLSNSDSHGTFRMSPPMLEFARKKYNQHPDPGWEQRWIEFWRQHLASWNGCSPCDKDKNLYDTVGYLLFLGFM